MKKRLNAALVRSITAALAGVSTVTASQAMFLHHSYEPIRETPTGTSFRGLAAMMRPRVDDDDDDDDDEMTMTKKKKKKKKKKKDPRRTEDRKRVVILGDSLATGVGCTTNTPALARIVAERLADLLSVEIEWIAVGKKGAALSDISSCVIPELREKVKTSSSSSSISNRRRSRNNSTSNNNNNNNNNRSKEENDDDEEDVKNVLLEQASPRQADAVIILCGINDVKTCFLQGKIFFRENFENELENVIKEIKAVVGSDALVVLPGNPLHIAPLFPNPLREVILKLNDCWDGQKEKVAKKLGKGKALFINSPTLQALRDAVRMNDTGGGIREGEFTARDGVHPNDMGYKAWAHIIAEEVAKVLKDNNEV